MPKLTVEGLKVTYGPIVGTDGVSFTVDEGETVALIGSNGAGKSSTLKAVLGMVSYSEGRIALDGVDLKGLRPSQAMRRGIGFSPEGRRVFPQLTVLDNLRVGAISRPKDELPQAIERIYGYFPRLKERRESTAGYTSGGEQQMCAIGRALMSRPKMILLDEPSMGLAPQIVEEIFEIVRDLNEKEGVSFLLAEQNTHMALRFARYGYILENGRVVMDGEAKSLAENEDVKEFYLGISEGRRKSFRDGKHYRRRKRWLA